MYFNTLPIILAGWILIWDKISTDHGTHVAISELVAHDLPKSYLSPNTLDRGKTSPTFNMEPRPVILSCVIPMHYLPNTNKWKWDLLRVTSRISLSHLM